MAMPNDAKEELMKGTFDLVNDTIRVLLLDDSTNYSFDPDAHEYVEDLDGSSDGDDPSMEPTAASYSRQTLSNVSVTEDTTDDEGVFDADNVTFSGLDTPNKIQTIVVYREVGGDDTTPGNDEVLVVLDDNTAGSLTDLPLSTNGSDVTISWDTEGIINIA